MLYAQPQLSKQPLAAAFLRSLTVMGESSEYTTEPVANFYPPSLPAHDAVAAGLSVQIFQTFTRSFKIVPTKELLTAMGLSERTAQRLNADPSKTLDANASDRLVQLAKVRALAAEVLGTQDAAEQWLIAPAFGLEQRRPIDLMRSTDGIHLVTQLLSRIQHGVYA
jgi:putative toxin-antitoxin system antitoxin component (TIGR02293 family)